MFAKTKGSDQNPTEDIYKSLVDAVTLLGNALYDFSMKRRELLKTDVAAGYKSCATITSPHPHCYLAMSFPRVSETSLMQVKRISLRKVTAKRKFVGENNSSRKFSHQSQNSRPNKRLNFTRRSDPRRPDPRRPWFWSNRPMNQQLLPGSQNVNADHEDSTQIWSGS